MRKREYLCLVPLPFLISLLLQYAISAMMNMLQLPAVVSDTEQYNAFFRTVVGCVYTLVFGYWYLQRFGRNREISLSRSLAVNHILSLIAIAVCGQVAISFLLTLILPLFEGVAEQYQATLGGLFELSPLTFLYVVILSPLGEECIFRGLTLHYARKAVPALAANLIQAALFGLYHWNLVQGIYAFIMGLVFGIVVIKLDSLWTAIIMHVVLNAAGLWMNAYLNTDLSVVAGVVICVLSIAIVVLSLYLLPTLKPEIHEEM